MANDINKIKKLSKIFVNGDKIIKTYTMRPREYKERDSDEVAKFEATEDYEDLLSID